MNLKNHQISTISQGTVQVNVEQISSKNFNALEEQWLQLEHSANTSFFLSWKWIGCWLKTIADDQKIYLVKAQKNDIIVGLGVFIEQNIVRHNLILSKQWLLHRTGKEEKDQIWIENNGFLLSEADKEKTHDTIWHYLLKHHNNVDEFIVYVAKKNSFVNLNITNKKYSRINQQPEFGYRIPLTGLSSLKEYLSKTSKNTRQQFNRSLKHLAIQGELEFAVIEKPQEQREVIDNTKHWHTNKWRNTLTPSGFENKEFCKFHNSLLKSTHPTATTLMAAISLNKQLMGSIYCLSDKKNVYFYLSCIKPITDNKIKLGLIMHVLMVEWLILQGDKYNEYDFLAGDARYKRSLSPIKDEYLKLIIQKNSLKFKIENSLKKIYTTFTT
ncbi:GNAT family N-acetyltransferase [Colwellia hornerae]|uniref:GNAT family N-acetyltransferase n=1 Tax=Colwellia hornerae TaxID=89402 RepID=A0A5C6QHA5_9GAMM|nr:GNAT family N-acetyltransferase [Colwellia hornerae]TWX52482.1 GNAT family N-acetyltransferase [Colwellia hornerae]TWX58311.1 GNAT family N-acetyltransferase [Colwellia hornerae]TWX68344.1 GNAT family N-acetyltransferase [Colwellia hornerae]